MAWEGPADLCTRVPRPIAGSILTIISKPLALSPAGWRLRASDVRAGDCKAQQRRLRGDATDEGARPCGRGQGVQRLHRVPLNEKVGRDPSKCGVFADFRTCIEFELGRRGIDAKRRSLAWVRLCAPLDDYNVERFCDLLDEMSKRADTRFVTITHNPITMARMDRLFLVTMAERGVSQIVSVELAEAGAHRGGGVKRLCRTMVRCEAGKPQSARAQAARSSRSAIQA